MILINNNDDTFVTISYFLDIPVLAVNYYLKFIDSTETNSKVLELANLSNYIPNYSKFLVLEDSGIPIGRGSLEFYASETSGLTEMNPDDLIQTNQYELKAVKTFEIVQYFPEKVEYVFYKSL
jgi:hypothetical protein